MGNGYVVMDGYVIIERLLSRQPEGSMQENVQLDVIHPPVGLQVQCS